MRLYLSYNTERAIRKTIRALPILLLLAGIIVLLHGCSPRIVESIKTVYKDSLVREYKDTTIYLPIPLESHQVIADIRDTSHLKTTLAESTAFIGKDGHLHHELRNRADQKVPVIFKIPVTTVFHGVTTEKQIQLAPQKVYVEKPLSKWKQFKLDSFWYLAGSVLALLLWTFRKTILKLAKIIV